MADTGVSRPGRILSLSVGSTIMTLVTRARPAEAGHYDRSAVRPRAEMRRVLSHQDYRLRRRNRVSRYPSMNLKGAIPVL